MKNRVLTEFERTEDAKKVEETVKTGYIDTTIENLVQWCAVEDDLADTYGRMAAAANDQTEKAAFKQLHDDSERNKAELSKLLRVVEELDKARIGRIEKLSGLS
ncbi:MAG: hypothetical protein JRN57_03150 [Nitrososphaerota archaeon]|nr:hypothetical protein [Nitrososphaerota archaeon]